MIETKNVKQLSDKVLIEQTDFLVQTERKTTLQILQHLREIEIRRLFIDLEYSSMYDYCLGRLKYSEGETQRRLASARLLTELPEIEIKIQSGDLNITNLAKIQSFVKVEKESHHDLSKDEKLDLITHLQGKSTRQVEGELIKYSHQPALMAEKFQRGIAVINDASATPYLKFEAILDPVTQELLQEFKNLYAHELQDHSNQSLLRVLLKKAVQAKKKKLGLIPVKSKTNALLPSASKVKPQRKPLKISVKRKLWQRADACCEHVDRQTGKRCTSKFALEIDHVKPLALRGTDDLTNLQLLCRAHNSRRSIQTFGKAPRVFSGDSDASPWPTEGQATAPSPSKHSTCQSS